MNDFINYLNATNNVGGNTVGSLAEAQVKTEYYNSIKVDRRLGDYIAECIKSGNHKAFILTGHAGDGKTSILIQVLKELDMINPGDSLECSYENDKLFYVKDMSEFSSNEQCMLLEEALNAPQGGKSSLIISNTGPLLKTFETIVENNYEEQGKEFTDEDKMKLQSELLQQLDTNENQYLTIDKYEFVLINIARVDNVPFAKKILKNIISPSLWTPCEKCDCASFCPIKNNRDLIESQFYRVSTFIESYYRYLYENDKRMTIRQIMGQISYAITGNLTCDSIKSNTLKQSFKKWATFDYNFANLFFGYRAIDEAKDTDQIKSIRQIKNLALDKIALDCDYLLFVKQNFDCFKPNLQDELTKLYKKYRNTFEQASEDDDTTKIEKRHKKELKLRQAVRRFYLMFSMTNDGNIESILNQIYGPQFARYVGLISQKQNKVNIRKLQDLVFEALYIRNTGFIPESVSELPLTLRREDGVFQNVMISLGTVRKSDLKIIQKKIDNKFEDTDEKYDVYLDLPNSNESFKLSLPMITYFNNLVNGSISSNNNPALTHGIAMLDTLLLDCFGEEKPESKEDCELTVVINTTNGQKKEILSFDDRRLNIQ